MSTEIWVAIIAGGFTIIAGIIAVVVARLIQAPARPEEPVNVSVHDSDGVIVDSAINTKGGDVFPGGSKVVNYFAAYDYQQLVEQIKELENDLKVVPQKEVLIRLQKSKKLEDLKGREQSLKQEILRTAETFNKIEINTDRLRQAKAYFEKGEFKEADKILKENEMIRDKEQLLEARRQKEHGIEVLNKQLKDNANEFLIKAHITGLDFKGSKRFENACHYYEQSINSYPLFENHFEYAYFLQHHNQNNKAVEYYRKILSEFGDTIGPAALAGTLNNLGNLQLDKKEFEDALKSYKEALDIRRELAKVNPQTYLPDVAITLNNLCNLQSEKKEFEDALKSYKEALDTYRELAKVNPQTYLPDVAITLNNLGNLQTAKNEFGGCLKVIQRGVENTKGIGKGKSADLFAGCGYDAEQSGQFAIG